MPDEVDFNPKTVIFGPIFETALLAHCEKKSSICEIRLIDYFDERETSRDDSHEDFFCAACSPLVVTLHLGIYSFSFGMNFSKSTQATPPAILPSQHLA